MARLSVVGGTDAHPVPHSPGPWRAVVKYRGDLAYTSVQPVNPDPVRDAHMLMASGEFYVCSFYHTADRAKIQLRYANARLIAAAPELLEALQFARDQLVERGVAEDSVEIQGIDATITKATT